MLRQIIAIVLVAILGLASVQGATLSACSAGCVSGVFQGAAQIGCANGDRLCVCGKTDSFKDGIRDCITGACAADGPDTQIPLAQAYGDQVCASVAAGSDPPPPPTASSPALASPESTTTEAAPTTTSSVDDSTTTTVSEANSSSQNTITNSEVASPEATSSASNPQATTAPISGALSNKVSPTTTSASASASNSASTATSSPSTASSSSEPAATSSTSEATAGLSTAAQAGIGAGVGAAALAAIIISICVCLRRRQRNKTANSVRNYKISEPMAVSDNQFGNIIGRAEAGLPRPIITTLPVHSDSVAMATSPTSLYSNSSDLESHARRYEDMPPRKRKAV
ncbi:hypothetical protein F5Y09DRAFT_345794 [Xylaria sp. FL1042]|nr:hypothetical protein F5Y09DRAFT_345794 [Xylaria sp. FL1042]